MAHCRISISAHRPSPLLRAFRLLLEQHNTPHKIWQFGEPGSWESDNIERYIRLRCRLLPYLCSTAWDNPETRVYPGADGTFKLYEDEGDNYDYEKGQYSEIPFSWDKAKRTLAIGGKAGCL